MVLFQSAGRAPLFIVMSSNRERYGIMASPPSFRIMWCNVAHMLISNTSEVGWMIINYAGWILLQKTPVAKSGEKPAVFDIWCDMMLCYDIWCIFLNCNWVYTRWQYYSTVKYSTVQCSKVQYSTMQYSKVQCSAVQYSTVHCNTVQYSTVQCNTVQ